MEKNMTYIVMMIIVNVDLKIETAFQLIKFYRGVERNYWSGALMFRITLCNTRFYDIFVVNVIV